VSPQARGRIRRHFDRRGIFINIPYAEAYTSLELAIISTATAYGLTPKMARQRAAFEVRFRRIWEMILNCAYGFTDLSYVTRMNMPLELGLMLALGKNCFITGRARYSGLRSISDLNLGDIHYHEGRTLRLITDFSRWIEQNCSRRHIEISKLVNRFRVVTWMRDYLGSNEFDRLTPTELSAMVRSAENRLGLRLGAIP
jgi:hypothetical protein